MLVHLLFVAGLLTAALLLAGLAATYSETGPRLWPHRDRDVFYWLRYLAWIVHYRSS